MPVITCPICEFSIVVDEWDSFSRQHPRCTSCGLLFDDGHLAVDTDGLCQYCVEEEIPYEISLNAEDSELDMEEPC